MSKVPMCLNTECPSRAYCAMRYVGVRDERTAEEFSKTCRETLDLESPAGGCEEYLPATSADMDDALARAARV